MDDKLKEYILGMREHGISDERIRENLMAGGWSAEVVTKSLEAEKLNNATLPMAPAAPRLGMWISFEYILLFVTMWIWTGAMGGIWNYGINKHLSDPAEKAMGAFSYIYGSYGSTFLQGYLAAILVTYPIFAVLLMSISKQLEMRPEIRNIKMRKLLMYITLVVNFLYLISTTIRTIFGFLNANTTTTTIPSLLVNFIISGSICLILVHELSEDRKMT
jgi:hypothetical protein